MYHEPSPHPLIKGFIADNLSLTGVRILGVLMKTPGRPHNCLSLIHLADIYPDANLNPTFRNALMRLWNPIPMTDRITIQAVKKEITRLIENKAERLKLGLDTLKLDAELDKLSTYLKECLSPSQNIRNFRQEEHRAYDITQKAISRMLERAARLSPEVYHYLRSHLKIGILCEWKAP
ncbi:MAG: hypothetical protein PHI68_00095 [Candidatus Cloacimonetes bacterium]|nr:hypothetical protein [Candidatus Cloacimonadota bacterium]